MGTNWLQILIAMLGGLFGGGTTGFFAVRAVKKHLDK